MVQVCSRWPPLYFLLAPLKFSIGVHCAPSEKTQLGALQAYLSILSIDCILISWRCTWAAAAYQVSLSCGRSCCFHLPRSAHPSSGALSGNLSLLPTLSNLPYLHPATWIPHPKHTCMHTQLYYSEDRLVRKSNSRTGEGRGNDLILDPASKVQAEASNNTVRDHSYQ